MNFSEKGYYDIQENGNNNGEAVFDKGYMEITYEILPNYNSK